MFNSSVDFFTPFIQGMELEGFYGMKPACYNKELINPDDVKCLHGSKWTPKAQAIMGGDISDKHATISTNDNFHQVWTTEPVHLPTIKNTCDGKTQCELESITVSEAFYERLSDFDTGLYPVAAREIKAKLMSRQSVQKAAGNKDADFHQEDEVGNRCAEINQEALNWALQNAPKRTQERYEKFGKKLVIGDDLGPYNAGPLWIWHYLAYDDAKDKKTTVVHSPMMRTPTNYLVKAAAGFHYCKLLTPFRALEWMAIDAFKDGQ